MIPHTNTGIIIRHSKKLTINYPQFSLDTRIIKIALMILHAKTVKIIITVFS